MRLNALLVLVLLSGQLAAQSPYNVLDWKANTTLNSYLMQELHRQYASRPADLAQATTTAEGTRAYRDSVRARFRRVLGPLPATRTPLHAQTTGTLTRPGFRIEKIIFESTPHHHVTANLYVPEGRGKWPAVLFPCGHEAEGKATVSYQKTAMLFATHGFAVLVPDPVSQGERMQLTDASGKPLTRGGTTEHTLLNAQANLLGRTLAAAELWDNVRGLDYLSTRPEVDTARLGCLGNSGGATQTAYLMAYDPRLKAAALCSYVAAGERNLELTGPADGCVMLPGAGAARLDMGDWLIAFAPKPLLVLAGEYDFVDYTSIKTACTEATTVYAALGIPSSTNKVQLANYEDGHGISRPKREEAVSWFRAQLVPGSGYDKITEALLPVATVAELQCTSTGQVNSSFADEENLTNFYQADARHLEAGRPALTTLLHLQAQLMRAMSSLAFPFEVETHSHSVAPIADEHRDTLHYAGLAFEKLILRGKGTPLPALLLQTEANAANQESGRVIMCFADSGKAALAGRTAWLRSLLKTYTMVLLVDLRGQGETSDPAAFNEPKYYNRDYRPALLSLHLRPPLLAQRQQDVATVLQFLEEDRLPVDLYADGPSSARVALHAATLTARIKQVRLTALPPSFQQLLAQPTAKDTYSDVLPGVLRRYDVPDLVRALGTRLVVGAGLAPARIGER